VFDFDDNSMKLDLAELVAQKPAANPGDAGFRVDLTVGASVPRIAASAGFFRDDSGKAGDVDVHQAYASWNAPLGSGLRLDFGKFVTPFGAEVIDGYDGWNDNATRSFLFGYAIPYTHAGARAGYTFSPQVAGSFMLVNGWDNVRDNNTGKTALAQVALTPSAKLSGTFNVGYGPEKNGTNDGPRLLLDGVVVVKPADRLTLTLNGDYGSENSLPADGQTTTWTWKGLAAYARCTLADRFALIARGEVFDDPDGVRTGTAQTLAELTLTPEFQASRNAVLRCDFRMDHSDQPVFVTDTGAAQHQVTVLLNALVHF